MELNTADHRLVSGSWLVLCVFYVGFSKLLFFISSLVACNYRCVLCLDIVWSGKSEQKAEMSYECEPSRGKQGYQLVYVLNQACYTVGHSVSFNYVAASQALKPCCFPTVGKMGKYLKCGFTEKAI